MSAKSGTVGRVTAQHSQVTSNTTEDDAQRNANTSIPILVPHPESPRHLPSLSDRDQRIVDLLAYVRAKHSSETFSVTDIGFFDPRPSSKLMRGKAEHNVYHDVSIFISKVRIRAEELEERTITTNLSRCFLGDADQWYTFELDQQSRGDLKSSGLDSYCKRLADRFSVPTSESIAMIFHKLHYTIQDCSISKDPSSFLNDFIRHARNCGIGNTHAMLELAYDRFDPALRQWASFKPPLEDTTVEDFHILLRKCKHHWFELYDPTRQEQCKLVTPPEDHEGLRNTSQ